MRISKSPEPRTYTSFHAKSQMLLNSSFIMNLSCVYQSSNSNKTFKSRNIFENFTKRRRSTRLPKLADSLIPSVSPRKIPKIKLIKPEKSELKIPKEKFEIPKFRHSLYRKFIDEKNLGLKCKTCRKIQCKCEKDPDKFIENTAKKMKILSAKRNTIINSICSEFRFKPRTLYPQICRSHTPKSVRLISNGNVTVIDIAKKLMSFN